MAGLGVAAGERGEGRRGSALPLSVLHCSMARALRRKRRLGGVALRGAWLRAAGRRGSRACHGLVAAPCVSAACPRDWSALQDTARAQPLGVPNGTGSQAQHCRGLGAPEAMPRTRHCMGLGCPSAAEDGSTGTCRPGCYTGASLLASWGEGAVLTHLVLVHKVHRGHVAWYCSGCVLVRRAPGKQPTERCRAGRAGGWVTPRLASSCTCASGDTGQGPWCRLLARAAPCSVWLGVPGLLPAGADT